MFSSIRGRRRASALIVSIAVLAVLALIAITFARLTVLERDVSRNYRIGVQARLNAESGIERVIAWFNDPDNVQAGYSLADPTNSPWLYRNDVGSGTDVGAGMVDLADSDNPSFEYLESPHCSGEIPVAAFSPLLRNTRSFYKLKCVDSSSQINLNASIDGDLPGVPCLLRRLLQNLGTSIQSVFATPAKRPPWWAISDPVPNPFPPAVIQEIITLRTNQPLQIFREKDQIRGPVEANASLTAGQKALIWDLIKDYLTVWGWDNDRAVEMGEIDFDQYNTNGRTWWRPGQAWSRKTKSLDRILPILQPRQPINVNTAPKVVLIANLLGLGGAHRRKAPNAGLLAGSAQLGNHPWLDIDVGTAGTMVGLQLFARIEALVDEIVAYRSNPLKGPFKSWDQFIRFLEETAVKAGFNSWLDKDNRDLLLANVCPNWMSNQFVPEPHRYFTVSKLLIFNPTVEFCFNPMGYVEVESIGWVQDEFARTIAESRIEAIIHCWDVLYRTSQRDFLDELVTSRNVITGPEPMSNVLNSTLTNPGDPLLATTYGSAYVSRGGNPYEGWIQVLSENVTLARSGGSLVFNKTPTYDPNQSFYHPFWESWAPQMEGTPPPSRGYSGEGASNSGKWKKTGETVFRGESLTPDGATFFNYNDEEISFDASVNGMASSSQNFRPDLGTIEFWLKLPAAYDPSTARPPGGWGAHEALAYITQIIGTYPLQDAFGTNPPVQTTIGVTWKLERYGYKIRSTRFLWFGQVPNWLTLMPAAENLNQVDYLWTEVEFQLNTIGWKDDEWHHFAHSWNKYTNQVVYVDGQRAAWRVEPNAPSPVGGTSFGVRYTTNTADTDFNKRFELVSITPDQRAFFGGYIYTKTSTMGVFRGQGDLTGQENVRMSNSKMDEIKAYRFYVRDPSANPAGYNTACNKKRFEPTGGAPFWEGEMTFDRPGRVALVQFTVLSPPGPPNPVPTVESRVTINSNPYTSTAGMVDAGGERVVDGQTMRYRTTFLLGTGYNRTPIVDDMTVFLVVTPSFVLYRQVFDR